MSALDFRSDPGHARVRVREVIGLDVGGVESEAFWVECIRSLRARGLQGVRLAISDQHEGLIALRRSRASSPSSSVILAITAPRAASQTQDHSPTQRRTTRNTYQSTAKSFPRSAHFGTPRQPSADGGERKPSVNPPFGYHERLDRDFIARLCGTLELYQFRS